MKQLKRLLPLILLITGFSRADLPTSPVFTIATNSTTLGITAVPPASNVGQFFHELVVTPSDITAASCAAGWGGLIKLEGAFDNVTWTQLGIVITSAPNNTAVTMFAEGFFPFLRVNYVIGNTSQCRLTIGYLASLNGIVPTFLLTTFAADPSVNTELQLGAACTGSKISIYFLSLVNDSVANGFTFKVKVGATFGGAVIDSSFLLPATFPANGEYILPMGQIPYFRPSISVPNNQFSFFSIQATNATSYHIIIDYRCE